MASTDPYSTITAPGEDVNTFGIALRKLDSGWLILFREQSHRGRCIVSSDKAVDDISDLTPEESAAFMADVRRVAKAMHLAFNPDKLNFGAYGDKMHHLHFHLVPKYASDPYEFGGVFAMNPGRTELTDAECKQVGDELLAALDKVEE